MTTALVLYVPTYSLQYNLIEQKPQRKDAIRQQLLAETEIIGRRRRDCRLPKRHAKRHGVRRSHILGNCRHAIQGGVIWTEV